MVKNSTPSSLEGGPSRGLLSGRFRAVCACWCELSAATLPTLMKSVRIDESKADSACAPALRCIRKVRSTEHCQIHPCPKLWWGVSQDVPYAPQKKRGGKLQPERLPVASGTSNCHFILKATWPNRHFFSVTALVTFLYP